MFGGQRLQNGIEGMTIGKQRMKDDEVAAGACSNCGQSATAGTQLLCWH
jgi:hypothetical protein